MASNQLIPDRYIRYLRAHLATPWEPSSQLYQLANRLHRWQETLSPQYLYSVDNLYAHHGSSDFGPFAGMHLQYHTVLAALYNFAFPVDSSTSYLDTMLAGAPPDWTAWCRRQAYEQALKIREILIHVEQHFPEFVPASRMWTRSVHESLRIQLQYLAITNSAATFRLTLDSATRLGLQTMLRTVDRVIKFFSAERKLVSSLCLPWSL